MLCITVDELSTFLNSSSDLKNLKVITFKFFRSEDDFKKVESSSTVIQSNVFTAYYSQTKGGRPNIIIIITRRFLGNAHV